MNIHRGRLAAGVLLASFMATASAQEAGFPYPPILPDAAKHTYKTVEDIVLDLWVFEPEGHAPTDVRPAAVFFFGGGWRTGSPAQFERQAKALRDRGMVGIVVDYRVSSRHGTSPWHAVADAHDALRWVRSHAAELGVDPGRIAAAGGSAGGHLAAATATLAHPEGPEHAVSRPNALMLFNPAVVIADIGDSSERSQALAERFERPLKEISPYHYVAAGHPPTFIVHGEADTVVPSDDAVAYCERVVSVGGDCDLALHDGAGHGFFNRGPYFESTLDEMIAFLEGLDWL